MRVFTCGRPHLDGCATCGKPTTGKCEQPLTGSKAGQKCGRPICDLHSGLISGNRVCLPHQRHLQKVGK